MIVEIQNNPDYFLWGVYNNNAHFFELNKEDLKKFTFLSSAPVLKNQKQITISKDELKNAFANDVKGQHLWIFHIGHGGSTLLCRYLEHNKNRVFKEPNSLHQTSNIDASLVVQSLARHPGLNIIKVSSILARLIHILPGPKIFLYQNKSDFIASMLKTPNHINSILFKARKLLNKNYHNPVIAAEDYYDNIIEIIRTADNLYYLPSQKLFESPVAVLRSMSSLFAATYDSLSDISQRHSKSGFIYSYEDRISELNEIKRKFRIPQYEDLIRDCSI